MYKLIFSLEIFLLYFFTLQNFINPFVWNRWKVLHQMHITSNLRYISTRFVGIIAQTIENYHRADMRRSLGMNIFCQKNNTSACEMWFIEYKCINCSRNCKYKCILHPNTMADPRLTYSSCLSLFVITPILLMSALWTILFD